MNINFQHLRFLFALATLYFLAELVFGVPDYIKKIVLPILLLGIIGLAGILLYRETRPQKISK